jgi:hypothetical protein
MATVKDESNHIRLRDGCYQLRVNTPFLRHPEPPLEQREVTTVKVMIQCSPAEFYHQIFNAIKIAKSSSLLLEIFSQCKNPVVKKDRLSYQHGIKRCTAHLH